MIIPLVAGEVYQTSTEIDLKQQCFDNGEFCSTSAQCNFTIVNPENLVIVDNLAGTNQVSFHNYTLQSWETNNSGVWIYTVTCTDSPDSNFNEFEFTVNPSGIDFSQQRTDAFSRSIYIIFALAIVLFVSGFLARSIPPVKWSLFIIGGMLLIMVINLVLVGLRDEVVNENVINLFDTVVASTFYLYWGAAVMIFIIWVLTVFMSLKAISERKKQEKILGFNG